MVAVMAMALGALVGLAAPAAADGPTAVVEPRRSGLGDEVVVRGDGWPAGTVLVEVCGNVARRGSTDCAVAAGTTGVVRADGAISVPIVVTAPPVPCPCAVRVTAPGGPSVTTGIVVEGVAVDPGALAVLGDSAAPAPGVLEIVDVALGGTDSWAARAGASPERTLGLTLRNQGTTTLAGMRLSVAVGEDDQASGFVTVEQLEPLAPGESRRVVVPVELGPLTFGDRTVVVSVEGLGALGEPVRASATTTSYPWLLLVPAVLVGQWVLLGLRNRARRRVARAQGRVAATVAPDPSPTDAPTDADAAADATAAVRSTSSA